MSTPASFLSFYRSAPQQRVALDDFQELGQKRVKLLSQISAYWCSYSTRTPSKNLLNEIAELQQGTDADLLSHYALRLAFCRTQSFERVGLAGHCRNQTLRGSS
ncbi:hypothetical protein PC118_g8606 [Phytophthora cactorum]|uniref:Uncharacterized protein n=1 Tax=Phytophthora cactorum TaxID=29920 RepID=A0A8T1CKE4_9STRA|nr:hypothetical protein PC113_g3496 [Phytophthora cactorum]KAG2925138.1 hypothetical protein PC115_g8397 [Phytophthora cactorum]KAG2984939.1 hypothetical protein PC118_g8606 [Phytophthora cactorum]